MNTDSLLFKLVALDFLIGETIIDEATGEYLFILNGQVNSDGSDSLTVVCLITALSETVKLKDILNYPISENSNMTYLEYIKTFYGILLKQAEMPSHYSDELAFGERCYDRVCPKYAGRLVSIWQGYGAGLKATIRLNGSTNFKHVIPLAIVEFGVPSSDESMVSQMGDYWPTVGDQYRWIPGKANPNAQLGEGTDWISVTSHNGKSIAIKGTKVYAWGKKYAWFNYLTSKLDELKDRWNLQYLLW